MDEKKPKCDAPGGPCSSESRASVDLRVETARRYGMAAGRIEKQFETNNLIYQRLLGRSEALYVQAQIARRAVARAFKDYARADAIRDVLALKFIVLTENQDGTTLWQRSRNWGDRSTEELLDFIASNPFD